MSRRVSVLCLIGISAIAVLFAAPVSAGNFQVSNHGTWAITEILGTWPLFEAYAVCEVDENDFGFTKMRAHLRANFVTGEMEGNDVYLTEDGTEALFGRFTGYLVDFNPDTGLWTSTSVTQEFLGGTGRFAGVRGSAHHECHFLDTAPTGLLGEYECTSDGHLSLADLEIKPVPMVTREGITVAHEEQLEALPWHGLLSTMDVTVGTGTHYGLYRNTKHTFFDVSGPDPGALLGFFESVTANGDLVQGYYEGTFVPLDGAEGPMDVAVQSWITGGTGNFANASGRQSGGGLLWPDGSQDIALQGWISSVGSSRK